MKNFVFIVALLIFTGCGNSFNKQEKKQKETHPSHKYHFVEIDTTQMHYFETDYLPVYSDIYFGDGTKRFPITATVSLRNTSLTDSAYILSARYYDSYGKMLHAYIDSTLLLSPLESVELVVEEGEKAGGAGANFIIDWAAPKYSNQMLIQSVMISTYGQQGVSFLSEAKVILRKNRE
ncbi:MAG TPA: hypothetical protein DER09_02550 [Prolixibacteraceae bacterium]|nr:hypothetical protein [Prolixibacteraceae bacterium]